MLSVSPKEGVPKEGSLWAPEDNGISVSIMKDWMACRELARFRIVGLREKTPSFALTYGIVVHDVMQKVHTAAISKKLKGSPSRAQTREWIRTTEAEWRKKNVGASPKALENLELSLLFADAVLPVYYEYWSAQFKRINWISCEEWFKTPFEIWSAKTIPFIGKYDAVFEDGGLYWLLETKTKSRVDEGAIGDILPMDFQTNSYLVSLRRRYPKKVGGSVYNVIRRPGLRQGKSESIATYAKRCAKDVEQRPDFYFIRYRNRVVKSDIDLAEKMLIAVMGEVWGWWHGSGTIGHFRNTQQCENKYGTCPFLPVCSRGERHGFINIRDKKGVRK